jgi:hypothetical protein
LKQNCKGSGSDYKSSKIVDIDLHSDISSFIDIITSFGSFKTLDSEHAWIQSKLNSEIEITAFYLDGVLISIHGKKS